MNNTTPNNPVEDLDASQAEQLTILSRQLEALSSEKTNPAAEKLDTMTALEIALLMNRMDQEVDRAVAKTVEPISQAIECAANSIRKGGRIIYVGAGTSGRLGVLDASEIPPTFSAPPDLFVALIAGGPGAMFRAVEGAEDDPDQGALDIAETCVDDRDMVVGLAVSGRTPYVLGALAEAQSRNAKTVGICCNADSPLEKAADISITPVVGPEILTGSTRLKSGTAQKMVLNMISTGAMVRVGKCYGNRMVDLAATNDKLRARAINLVCDLTPTDRAAAFGALVASGWDIKVAILIGHSGVGVEAARSLIGKCNGHLRMALETVGTVGHNKFEDGRPLT